MGYGENIRAARKAAGLTQEQLAQKCKLATITIRQYELEKREPSFAQLKIIASALDVTVPFLQGYESMDARKVVDALKANDYRELERIMGVQEGSIMPLSDDEREYVEARTREDRRDLHAACFKIKIDLSKLNPEGRRVAVERVAELTKIPDYQKGNAP